MATRGTFSIVNRNGSVTSIYSHWDNYPEGAGTLLEKYYNTEEKVRELLSYGDVNSLGESIEDTKFYVRDLSEHGNTMVDCSPVTFKSLEEFKNSEFIQEYNYVFENGNWTHFSKHYWFSE